MALEDPSRGQNPDGSLDSGDTSLAPRTRSSGASSRNGSRAGAIIAGVLVSVVGAATLAAVVVCVVKRRQVAQQEWAHPLSKPLRISSGQNSANSRFVPVTCSPRSYSHDSAGTASPRFSGGIGSCGSPRMNARLVASAGPLAEGVLAVTEDALDQAAIAAKAAERWRSFGGTSSDGGASVASVEARGSSAGGGLATEGVSAAKPEPADCGPLKSARLHTEASDAELPSAASAETAGVSALISDSDPGVAHEAHPEISAERASLRPEDSSLGGALTEPYRHSLTSTEASDELPLPEVEPKAFMVSSNSLFEDEGVGMDEADQLPGWAPVRAPACHLLSLDEEDRLSDSSMDSK